MVQTFESLSLEQKNHFENSAKYVPFTAGYIKYIDK